MNNAKLRVTLTVFLSFLLLVAEGILLLSVRKLDMLPDNLLIIVAAILALIWMVVSVLLIWPSRNSRKIRSCVASFLVVAIIAGCGVGCHAIGKLYNTIHSITQPNTTTSDICIYVMADDPAHTLNDAAAYRFGIAYTGTDSILEDAVDTICSQLNGEISLQAFATVPELVNALYEGQIQALIMDNVYESVLEDFELYADFHTRTRILHTVTIQQEIPSTPSRPTTPDADQMQQATEDTPFIMYLSGSDTRNPTLSKSRSDVNILVVVNPKTKQILMVNTPRDYYVANPAGNGVKDKLTHCGIFGIDCSVKALSDLYNVPIKYYAQINFYGFQTLIDSIGGITVYSDIGFNAGGGQYYFPAGMVELTGAEALAFARERHGVPGGDNTRGKNQMKVISAVIDKLTSGTTIISNYSGIMESLQGMFQTNMEMDTISDLVKMQLKDMASWNIQSFAVTGKGSSQVTFSMPGQYVYVMLPHENTVAHASSLISRVLNGEVLTSDDMTVPGQ